MCKTCALLLMGTFPREQSGEGIQRGDLRLHQPVTFSCSGGDTRPPCKGCSRLVCTSGTEGQGTTLLPLGRKKVQYIYMFFFFFPATVFTSEDSFKTRLVTSNFPPLFGSKWENADTFLEKLLEFAAAFIDHNNYILVPWW